MVFVATLYDWCEKKMIIYLTNIINSCKTMARYFTVDFRVSDGTMDDDTIGAGQYIVKSDDRKKVEQWVSAKIKTITEPYIQREQYFIKNISYRRVWPPCIKTSIIEKTVLLLTNDEMLDVEKQIPIAVKEAMISVRKEVAIRLQKDVEKDEAVILAKKRKIAGLSAE